MQEVIFDALVHGVYVVTTRVGEKINGMTAAWVSQVSLHPPLVVVSIAPSRYSHDLIRESGVMAVNVLTSEQVELGKRFGYKSGRKVDKCAGLAWITKATGAPILPQAYAYLDLKIVSTFPAGDHTLFVGEVVEAKILHPQARPLVFKKSDFF
ncbi:MAG: flavin reductase family protein [Syntrophales bacterium]|nr:flavin reductase family protein [Syntrophales bacterium]MDD5642638.1 flavin reductase family protein [Syntrophales bacterium]